MIYLMAEVNAIKNIRLEEDRSGMGTAYRAVADIFGGPLDGRVLMLDAWNPSIDGPMPEDWFRLKIERARCFYTVLD